MVDRPEKPNRKWSLAVWWVAPNDEKSLLAVGLNMLMTQSIFVFFPLISVATHLHT